MDLQGVKIGFGITGSFCTFEKILEIIKKLKREGADVIPIISKSAYTTDTRFGESKKFINRIEEITNKKVINSIVGAEPLGPKNMVDIMVVAPATGNTIAKMAYGINDTAVTMAVKSTLRMEKPIVVAISTNDALSTSAKNIGMLLNTKHFYFVPFRQDNPITKPRSMVFDVDAFIQTIDLALDNIQIQPIVQ